MKIITATLVLALAGIEIQAKAWRGIVPLKSTRADVERLLGKENEFGRYQFEDERAYIFYSEGPCDKLYLKSNCECMVPEGTVLSIHVTLEVSRPFSNLKIDRTKYKRRLLRPGAPGFEYSNLIEGVIYRVDESIDEIIGINYLPSSHDCKTVIKRRGESADR